MKTRHVVCTVVVLLIAFCSFGQNKNIYVNPQFAQLAREHKVLAILPFHTTITLRPGQTAKLTAEQFKQAEAQEGEDIQYALQAFFSKQRNRKDFAIQFQNVSETKQLLEAHGITYANIRSYTPEQLAQLLGVDGTISGILITERPLSNGAALALGILAGYFGSTNSGKATINIHDGATGDLLWKYDKTISRGLGSDNSTLINALMRKASRKLPYLDIPATAYTQNSN